MQAVVKTPHIEITIKGDIPSKILSLLKKEYGKKVHITNDDEYIDIIETDWYKKMALQVLWWQTHIEYINMVI